MNTSNLTRANSRPRLSPEKLTAYSEAARLACKDADTNAPAAFAAAFAAYQTAFESTPVCPASAAYSAALAAARAEGLKNWA